MFGQSISRMPDRLGFCNDSVPPKWFFTNFHLYIIAQTGCFTNQNPLKPPLKVFTISLGSLTLYITIKVTLLRYERPHRPGCQRGRVHPQQTASRGRPQTCRFWGMNYDVTYRTSDEIKPRNHAGGYCTKKKSKTLWCEDFVVVIPSSSLVRTHWSPIHLRNNFKCH